MTATPREAALIGFDAGWEAAIAYEKNRPALQKFASTTDVSIVVFLQARLAEDEQFLDKVSAVTVTHKGQTFYQGGGFTYGGGAGGYPPPKPRFSDGDPLTTRRAQADIAAKKELVELFASTHGGKDLHADAWTVAKEVLRVIATTYSHHPDYREEWRPAFGSGGGE